MTNKIEGISKEELRRAIELTSDTWLRCPVDVLEKALQEIADGKWGYPECVRVSKEALDKFRKHNLGGSVDVEGLAREIVSITHRSLDNSKELQWKIEALIRKHIAQPAAPEDK